MPPRRRGRAVPRARTWSRGAFGEVAREDTILSVPLGVGAFAPGVPHHDLMPRPPAQRAGATRSFSADRPRYQAVAPSTMLRIWVPLDGSSISILSGKSVGVDLARAGESGWADQVRHGRGCRSGPGRIGRGCRTGRGRRVGSDLGWHVGRGGLSGRVGVAGAGEACRVVSEGAGMGRQDDVGRTESGVVGMGKDRAGAGSRGRWEGSGRGGFRTVARGVTWVEPASRGGGNAGGLGWSERDGRARPG
jgi:hypothetical protein